MNQIVDNRTVVDTAEATTNWVNDAGASFPGGINTDTFIKGSGSVAERLSSAALGFFVDLGAATDVTNNTFYFWYNVSTAGLLATLSAGGIRMRFCGATISDWFEVYLDGSDTYSGGWKMAVVNINEARTAAVAADPNTGTNGTVPAVTAIRYVGIYFNMASMVSGNVDNCFVDHAWRLPPNTPGIRVEGRNGGTSPWSFNDIVTAADEGDTTKAWGTAFRRNGVVFLNTPVQFGTDDATNAVDDFEATNTVVFFEDQRVPDDFYRLTVLGASGASASQRFVIGSRSGTGTTSTGSAGGFIGAPNTGFAPRWNLDMFDADIDEASVLGATLQRTEAVDIGNANAEIRSCTFGDGTVMYHSGGLSGGAGTGDLSKCSFANMNNGVTVGDIAYVETDDPSAIVDCSFTQGQPSAITGPAIEITASGTYTFTGNIFLQYAADGNPNSAILVDNVTATLNVGGGGSTPTKRELNGGSLTVNNNVAVTLTGMRDNTEVRVLDNVTREFLAGIEDATAGTADNRSFTFSLAAGTIVDIAIFNIGYILPPNNRIEDFEVPTTDASIPISQVTDRNFSNP